MNLILTSKETQPVIQEVKKQRYTFLDYLRGIAAVWMIQVHVVDVCLLQEWKTGLIYDWLNVSYGYVAVCFIFCAGSGFAVATEKKIDSYRKFEAPLWNYLRRLLLILLLAFWLHLPAFSLEKTLMADMTQLQRLFECDVLNTIVYSSLIALVLSMLIRSQKITNVLFIFLAIGCFLATPFVWLYDAIHSLPVWLAPIIAKQPISKFPLFPFSGYFFVGASFTHFFLKLKNKELWAKRIIVAMLILPFVLFTLKYSFIDYPGFEDWWRVSPGHSLFRVGCVVLLMMALYLAQNKIDKSKFSESLQMCGQESLFFYIFHLMLVYGTIANFGLIFLSQKAYKPLQTILVYIVITAVTYYIAQMWNSYKRTDSVKASRLVAALIVLFATIYMLVPAYIA